MGVQPGIDWVGANFTHILVCVPPAQLKNSHVEEVEYVVTTPESTGRRFRAYTIRHLDDLLKRASLTEEQRLRTRAVASVLPFRTNAYVIDELIDWDNAFDDPMFRLVFPQEDMLPAADVDHIATLLKNGASKQEITAAANEVRYKLNPHPAGQIQLNIPKAGEEVVQGLQHKYKETALFFPQQGQTCHAYCTRWIMTREFGRARRLPGVPAAKSTAAAEAACPRQTVWTWGRMYCIVS